jgi:hypothetical protein
MELRKITESEITNARILPLEQPGHGVVSELVFPGHMFLLSNLDSLGLYLV